MLSVVKKHTRTYRESLSLIERTCETMPTE